MPTLFILNRSDATRWDIAFKIAMPGDAVLLIQDGVLATTGGTGDRRIADLTQRRVKILALKSDMDARRVDMKHGVEAIDYEQLVDLLIRYDSTFS
jgi:sulfur relay protein TusB/DsrH